MTELEKAKAAYPKASASNKKMLEDIFGTESFQEKITDRVKSFPQAYHIFQKMKFKDALYKQLQGRKLADLSAFDKLLIIARVLQQDTSASSSSNYTTSI